MPGDDLPAAQLRDFLRRRTVETLGLLVAGLAVAFLIALLSASPRDPSFDTAADGPASNLMGAPGAYAADLALQTLGLASLGAVSSASPGACAWCAAAAGTLGAAPGVPAPLLLIAATALARCRGRRAGRSRPGSAGPRRAAARLGRPGAALAGLGPNAGLVIGGGGALLASGCWSSSWACLVGLPARGRGIAIGAGFLAGRVGWLAAGPAGAATPAQLDVRRIAELAGGRSRSRRRRVLAARRRDGAAGARGAAQPGPSAGESSRARDWTSRASSSRDRAARRPARPSQPGDARPGAERGICPAAARPPGQAAELPVDRRRSPRNRWRRTPGCSNRCSTISASRARS